jgi:NAD(P)H dehydrogenase (quinone)
MKKRILVIGATGLIGKTVAYQLNEDGFQIIVMSRSKENAKRVFPEEFEIIEADVQKPETISNSFHGIDALYISLPERNIASAMKNILRAAKASDLKQIIYTSGCTVKKENAWHPMIKGHYDAEQELIGSGIPYTIFRLTMVMDMIPRYSNKGKPFILGKKQHEWSWIHTSDIAKMASKAYSSEEAKNKVFTLFGKEKTTIPDAVDRYNEIFYPAAKKAKPTPYWIANIIALFAGSLMKYAISIFKYFEDHPEEGSPDTAYKTLGKPEMNLVKYFDSMNKQ